MNTIPSGQFSAVMVGITHWKTSKFPVLKEWANTVVKAATYELILNEMKNPKALVWDLS